MCKEVPIEDPTKCPHAALWDGMTLETWKQQTIWTSSKSTRNICVMLLCCKKKASQV